MMLPYLAFNELTNKVYVVYGNKYKKKHDVTDQFLSVYDSMVHSIKQNRKNEKSKMVEKVQWLCDIETHQEIEDLLGSEVKEGDSPDYLIIPAENGLVQIDLGDYVCKDGNGVITIQKDKTG